MVRKTGINYISITVILTLLCLSSKCDKDIVVAEYRMNPEVKEYIYFKTGTWWEYIDTASGEKRSVEVLSDTIYMMETIINNDDEKPLDRRESIVWTTSSYQYSATQLRSDDPNIDDLSVVLGKSSLTSGDAGTTIFFYPFKDQLNHQPHGLTKISLEKKMDSMNVLGRTYYDVVVFHDESNFTENGHETLAYIARNYGVIRTDIHIEEPQDYWKRFLLINSKIIQ